MNGVPNGGRVEIKRFVRAEPIFHSSGEGGADRAEGNIDFMGRYLAWGHTPQVFVDDTFTLAFTLDGTDSTGLTANPVVCNGIDIVVPVFDPKQRNGVYYIVYFAACGVNLSAGGATTGAAAAILSVKGLACTVAGAAQTAIQGMKLSFRANAEAYVDSSTGGIFTRPSGNLDWEFTCKRTIADLALAPALNSIGAMKMYVESAKSWDMSWGRVMGVEGDFDPQDPNVLSVDITAEKCASAAGVVGTIVNPAGVTVWPN